MKADSKAGMHVVPRRVDLVNQGVVNLMEIISNFSILNLI